MTRLVTVADYAWPIDPALLPDYVTAVCGYVGGSTPHVWTDAEVQRVKDSGRQWWPIWTVPQRGIGISDGNGAAVGMIEQLRLRSYPGNAPVFLDVEHSTWTANPAGAQAAIHYWKRSMQEEGWPNTFAYVPLEAGFDWVAYWTNTAPTILPAGWVGQQYGGEVNNGKYDLSVMDLDLLMPAAIPLPRKAKPMTTVYQNITAPGRPSFAVVGGKAVAVSTAEQWQRYKDAGAEMVAADAQHFADVAAALGGLPDHVKV